MGERGIERGREIGRLRGKITDKKKRRWGEEKEASKQTEKVEREYNPYLRSIPSKRRAREPPEPSPGPFSSLPHIH